MDQLTGIQIEPLEPGSPEWLKVMSASKVAAVMGLSPYDSRFSLFYRMRDGIELDDDDDPAFRRGHYLEPAIAQWFADQHPELFIKPGGCWAKAGDTWYTASPDRLAHNADISETFGVECKTEADPDGWGEPGTDQIPIEVRVQVMSQMDVVGTRRTYVACLTSYLEFREYVVEFNQDEADVIRKECVAFMDDLANDIRPNLDSHLATLQTLRAIHPLIEHVDVEITADLAENYQQACAIEKNAKAAKRAATVEVLDAMGNARRAKCLGNNIATRVAVGDALPFLRPARSTTR
jgi:putative phage-type endonuclease